VPYGQTKITVAVAGDEVPNSSDWNNLSSIHTSQLSDAPGAGIAIMDARAAYFRTLVPRQVPSHDMAVKLASS